MTWQRLTGMGVIERIPDERPGLPKDDNSGEHRWVSIVTHGLTKKQAINAHREGFEVVLDTSTILEAVICCFICELPYSDELVKRPCTGEPTV